MWGCETNAAGTKIYVAATSNPAESMYHELLHADLKIRGYRQHATLACITTDQLVRDLANALDNELQHHRIYPSFLSAGFAPERFYHDGDDATYRNIRAAIKNANPTQTSAAVYFLHYLSIIAPGGSGGEEERVRLEKFFRLKVPKDKLALVEDAADKMRAWVSAASMDPGQVTADIIVGLGDFDGWWIGASHNFPVDGHFIGAPFTEQEARSFLATYGAP